MAPGFVEYAVYIMRFLPTVAFSWNNCSVKCFFPLVNLSVYIYIYIYILPSERLTVPLVDMFLKTTVLHFSFRHVFSRYTRFTSKKGKSRFLDVNNNISF